MREIVLWAKADKQNINHIAETIAYDLWAFRLPIYIYIYLISLMFILTFDLLCALMTHTYFIYLPICVKDERKCV